jgi:hypothetical protein
VGTGGPLEAPFTLRAPLPAGTWTLVADGIIIEPVDVLFEVLVRPAGGGADVMLFAVEHHFDPIGGGVFDAVPFETTFEAPAAGGAGDGLIFRYSSVGPSTIEMAYVPNGDGEEHNGRIPFLELPPP